MQKAKNQIRTRMQGATPFFPNMLNNGNVEVCLKEDVDKVLAEKDKEIVKLKEQIALLQTELTQNQEYHNG